MVARVVLHISVLFFLSVSFDLANAGQTPDEPSLHEIKPRVAVIGGGGAGVTTAWLLEQNYDVTLYEKADRLGGDANTVSVTLKGKAYPIDAGFEFINQQGF